MIAITGYTGFVGKHLLELLMEDENSTEFLLMGRSPLPNNTLFCPFDLSSTDELFFYDSLNKVDVLIHTAARVHIMNDGSNDPLAEFRNVNTEGTLNLAKQAASSGVKRFIYISSIKVNGERTKAHRPFKFNDDHNPVDPYGVSKSEAEIALFELGLTTGMEIVVIRPPLVFGEGVKANFQALLKLVGKGLPLPFRSITRNKRSMVSVYNLIDLIKICIKHPNAANQVFLVSDDNDLSTAEVVALMAKVQGKCNFALPVPVWLFSLVAKLLNKQDVVDRLTDSLQLDIEHTKNSLNWKPPYSIEHGFKLAVKK